MEIQMASAIRDHLPRRLGRLKRNDTLEYWFALPAILVLLALVIGPMLWSLYTSFTQFSLVTSGGQTWVGLENYAQLLSNDRFIGALGNTAVYVVLGVGVQFVLGLTVALVMANYTSGIVTTVLFTALLLPMMMAPIVAGYVWKLMLNPSFGVVNYVLETVGIGAQGWTGSTAQSLMSVMLADVWQWTPFMVLLLYTGRITIPGHLYEAARMDGASRWFAFRHVTLPQMKGVIAVAILLRAMDAFKFFDKMFVMTRGGPGSSSELATYTNYLAGFNSYSMGEATAMSWVLVIIAVVLATLFLFALQRTEGGEDIV